MGAADTLRRSIAYLQVSTDQQGTSGLGLDAQRERCSMYASFMNCLPAEVGLVARCCDPEQLRRSERHTPGLICHQRHGEAPWRPAAHVSHRAPTMMATRHLTTRKNHDRPRRPTGRAPGPRRPRR